jgi:hydrophobe/amphiphile efflux-3 (HAE3) family protein
VVVERLYRVVASRPRTVLAIVAVLTAVLGGYATGLEIDGSISALFAEGDPEAEYQARIRELFGSEEVGVVAIIADDVYAPEVLASVRDLSTRLAAVDGVAEVVSLTTAVDPVADVFDPPLLVPEIPRDEAGRRALVDKLRERPVYLKNLVSPDGRATALNLFFAKMPDEEFVRRGIDGAIEAIVAGYAGPGKALYTGLPHFKAYSVAAMRRDLTLLTPATFAVVAVVLLLCFGSVSGVLIPIAHVAISLVWTLGIVVLLGGKLSLGSFALPPLLVVLATAYSLHVLADYAEVAGPGRSPVDVVVTVLEHATAPLTIVAMTTVLGFLSFLVNDIPSIRDLGIYAAIGVALAWLLALSFVPACLALLVPAPGTTTERFSERLERVLRAVAGFSIHHRRAVITAVALVTLAAIALTFRIRVDTDPESFFDPSHPIRRATRDLGEHFGGAMAFRVVLEGDAPGLMRKWDTLERTRALQREIDALPGVDSTVSFVDYLELLDRGSQRGSGSGDLIVTEDGKVIEAPKEGATTFWENPAQLEGVLQLVSSSPQAFARVVDADFARSVVLVRTHLTRSSDLSHLIERIVEHGRARFPPEIRVHPTGELILATRSAGGLVSGQIESVGLAAGVIFLILAVMFLSVRVGFVAMIPNLVPIAIFFGLMGITGVPLNLGTSIIAAMALGISVDDTIHLMTRLSREIRLVPEQEPALLRTFESVGKPAVFTALLLVGGYATLAFSTFVPLRQFGLLSAATIFAAVIADLVLLPALLATTRIITLWDLLRLKLGADPERTIPLFRDLRPAQARIVALMGELKVFAPGELVIRRGEQGDEMYVVLSGKAHAILGEDDDRRQVFEFDRGDVFGEMGLVRRCVRTADVVAVDALEVMSMDERFLARLQSRYPRIASKIFLNVSRILSDRLQAQHPPRSD